MVESSSARRNSLRCFQHWRLATSAFLSTHHSTAREPLAATRADAEKAVESPSLHRPQEESLHAGGWRGGGSAGWRAPDGVGVVYLEESLFLLDTYPSMYIILLCRRGGGTSPSTQIAPSPLAPTHPCPQQLESQHSGNRTHPSE